MKACDLLLHWLSYRGEASDAVVAPAREFVATKFGYALHSRALVHMLHRLGHIERPSEAAWVVVPPTLLKSKDASGHPVWHHFGARTVTLLQAFEQAPQVQLTTDDPDSGPQRWTLRGEESHVQDLATGTHCQIIEDRSIEVLSALPPLTSAVAALETSAPPTNQVENFELVVDGNGAASFKNLPYDGVPSKEGLYRELVGRKRWWGIADDECRELRSRHERLEFMWLVVARQSQLRLTYRKATKEFLVPHVGQVLPLLVERPLCLPSATLPRLQGKSYCFGQLEPHHARQVSRILGMKLTTE